MNTTLEADFLGSIWFRNSEIHMHLTTGPQIMATLFDSTYKSFCDNKESKCVIFKEES